MTQERPQSEAREDRTPVQYVSRPPARVAFEAPGGLGKRAWTATRRLLVGPSEGEYAEALRTQRRDTVLQRTVVLVWISVFIMPFAIWGYVALVAPQKLPVAIGVVLAAIGAVLIVRGLVRAGLFDRHYHLSMVVLVAGVFGPVASMIVGLTREYGAGGFFFSYFLIYVAFIILYPAELKWVLITCALLAASYLVGLALQPGGLTWDARTRTDVAYFLDVTVLGILLNRVICGLFFDERRGRIELRRARDALFSEMEVAQKIQMSLVPESPTLPGMQVAGLMLPASEVGGDYYDVITTAAGRRFLAIGDVSGHGVTSGLTMMMARASLVGALEAQPTASLPELYAALNRGLRHNLARMGLKHFMTCALVEHLGDGRFRAVGGHLPAMIYRFGSGAVEQIELAGVWLGVLDDLPPGLLPETDIDLGEGDHMLLYTDGVTELMIGREMFGLDRLRVIFAGVAAGGPQRAVEAVVDALQRFSGQQDDDVTLLCVQRQRERPPEQVS
jgi:hypothetical protein